jgi:MOSC domain-containing protein YiiM
MVTRRQDDLPIDIEVIRTILKNNDGNAGVELRALESGTVRRGDDVVIGS